MATRLLPSLTLVFGALACGPAPGDAAERASGQGAVAGARGGVVAGDCCDNALTLSATTSAVADTHGAHLDHAPSCLLDSSTARDVAFSFTLVDDAAVQVSVTTNTNVAVSIAGATCAPEAEVACENDAFFGEALAVPFLPAGEWRVVVAAEGDGHGGASLGPITVSLDINAPRCVGDANDPVDDAIAGAAELGAIDIDIDIDSDSDGGGATARGRGRLCPDDVDLFVVEHLGDAIDVDVDVDAGADDGALVEVHSAILGSDGAVLSFDASTDVNHTDQFAGVFVARITAPSATISAPIDYALTVTHGCTADALDHAPPRIDDAQAPPTLSMPLSLGMRAHSCDDVDAITLAPLGPADATVRIVGGAGVEIDTVPSALIIDDAGDRVVSIAGVTPDAPVDVAILAGGAASFALEVDYDFVHPANDECGAALPLLPGLTTSSATLGALDDRTGSCNGDTSTPDPSASRGGEVFFLLDVPTAADVEVRLDAADAFFAGTVELLAATDLGTCASIVRACDARRVRASLEAGQYLVAVESRAGRPRSGVPQPSTPGTFTLTATEYVDGFPQPEACNNPHEIAFPTATPSTELVEAAWFSRYDDMRGSCGGPAPEAVVTFVADVGGTVVIRSRPYSFDTLLHVRAGDCASGPEVRCNDDAVPRLENESEVTIPVQAGLRYFVIVDGFLSQPPSVPIELDVVRPPP